MVGDGVGEREGVGDAVTIGVAVAIVVGEGELELDAVFVQAASPITMKVTRAYLNFSVMSKLLRRTALFARRRV